MGTREHFRTILRQNYINDQILQHQYNGQGTEESPYEVEWLPNDSVNPMNMPSPKKWVITAIMSISTLAVSLTSTAFAGTFPQLEETFGPNQTLATLSVSLFVLGFALGPMLWAPLSELYGRQIIYFITLALCIAFGAGTCASQNIQTFLVLRFFAGASGASMLVNGAGVIADIFAPRERGMAITAWSSAPFLGPCLGPLCGGLLSSSTDWRWVGALTVAFDGLMWIVGFLAVPETYGPYLVRDRARRLSKITKKVYKSRVEIEKGAPSARQIFSVTLKRPWIILMLEPISLLLAIYTAIVYGTLFLIFAAFPIVFEGERHWSQAISSLSFSGIIVGQVLALLTYIYMDKYYRAYLRNHGGRAPPEQRLIPCLVGSVLVPVGLFWFAFTTYTSVPWIVSIIGSAFFGLGQVLVFLSLINYIIDDYTLYSASSLAANAILRALFGFAFPLFTKKMYDSLGIQWASSIPAFLALACVPFPFLFYRYGKAIRKRCPYSAESMRLTEALYAQNEADEERRRSDVEKSASVAETQSPAPSNKDFDADDKHDDDDDDDKDVESLKRGRTCYD